MQARALLALFVLGCGNNVEPITPDGPAGDGPDVIIDAPDVIDAPGAVADAPLGDSDPPETVITAKPSAISGPSVAFLFEADEPASFECRLDGAAFAPCSSPHSLTGLDALPNPHVFEVRAIDAAGNVDASPAMHEWVVDPNALDTTITGAPAQVSGPDASFDFTGSRAGTFECRLSPIEAAFTPCAPPKSYAGLSDADTPHTFEVRAVDTAGNVDPSPAEYTFTVDSTGPTVSIVSPGGTTGPRPTLTFQAEAGATMVCRVDDGAPFACDSGSAISDPLATGSHTLSVQGTDAHGNVGPEATARWDVDADAPLFLSFAKSPDQPRTGSAVTFSWTVSDGTVTCLLDGTAPTGGCPSPLALGGLATNTHTFRVTAADAYGNTAEKIHVWEVDATRPTLTKTLGPDSQDVTGPDVEFRFTLDEPGSTACTLDGNAIAGCASPLALTGLDDGNHVLVLTGSDQVGNAADPLTIAWSVDADAPVITFSPEVPAKTGANVVISYTVAGGRVTACAVDDAAIAAAQCASPWTLTALEAGSHTIVVRASDGVNPAVAASRSFTVDTTPPTLTMVTMVADPYGVDPTGHVWTGADVTFTYAAGDDDPASLVVMCELDGEPVACSATSAALADLPDGIHTLVIRASDGVNTAETTRTWTVDTVAPTVAEDPDNPWPNEFALTGPTVMFHFLVSGAVGIQCRVDDGELTDCAPPTFTVEVGTGSHTFTVLAWDALYETERSTTWFVDADPPALTVIGPPNGARVLPRAAVKIIETHSDGSVTCEVGPAAGTLQPIGCEDALGPFPPPTADYTYRVTAVDRVGNRSEVARTFTVDYDTPLEIAVLSPAPGALQGNPVDVAFIAALLGATPAPRQSVGYQCLLDWASSVPCYPGAHGLRYATVAAGRHVLAVAATSDGVTAYGATYFSLSAAPPAFTVTNPPRAATQPASFRLAHDLAGPVSCLLDDVAAVCDSGKTLTPSSSGLHHLRFLLPGGHTHDLTFYTAGCGELTSETSGDLGREADTLELFHFNDAETSQRVEDASGNGGHGVLGMSDAVEAIDPLYDASTAVGGWSVRFLPAEGDSIRIDAGSDVFSRDGFTLEAWVYPFADGVSGRVLEAFAPFGLVVNAGRPQAYVSSPGFFPAIAADSLTPLTWTYIAVTYAEGGTKGILTLYVNGVEAAATAVTPQLDVPTVTGYRLGPIDGLVDEVRISNGAVTDTAIKDYYDTASRCP